ncbi:MAG TPA: VacJ family lipoprotein [Thermohalobaculum sp.]|nr:VacJ family lipoprotein [Thermohalobaculum sp.]
MRKRIASVLLAFLVSACASGEPGEGQLIADPYENVNREIHSFNKGIDTAVVNPASKAYDFVTPALGKFLISNALSHLTLPGAFANHVMQGDLGDAGETLARFTLNTVLGAAGFLDPATEFGADYIETDFGLTLAEWGVGTGAFLELPLFGPSTTRDAVGRVVDSIFVPTGYLVGSDVVWGVRALDLLDTRDRYRALIDDVLYESEDSYRASRNAYIQNRRSVQAGETQIEALPDIFIE